MRNANKSPKIPYSALVRKIRNPYLGPEPHQNCHIAAQFLLPWRDICGDLHQSHDDSDDDNDDDISQSKV